MLQYRPLLLATQDTASTKPNVPPSPAECNQYDFDRVKYSTREKWAKHQPNCEERGKAFWGFLLAWMAMRQTTQESIR